MQKGMNQITDRVGWDGTHEGETPGRRDKGKKARGWPISRAITYMFFGAVFILISQYISCWQLAASAAGGAWPAWTLPGAAGRAGASRPRRSHPPA